ncbi:alkaline phosphatase D family protein [Mariniblastus sp.]|nr:alkaline phosphatase D family protein [Mariniblastus sp.]MDA7885183.1 alkaline phosphatase D family protein [bacterium]MDA7901831.1 alkaline phosphatase D family protein [bacterium]MDA7902338.1 alkaline phosphatase D family protein [Mariniblastus sp.]MDA7911828.1 alkaline phosphatase D family protein [bacterium]
MSQLRWSTWWFLCCAAFVGGQWTGMLQGQEVPHLTQGPVLGRLSAHGIGIWARTNRPGQFSVQYGVEPEKLTQTSDLVTTELAHDNTGWIHLKGLSANTRYYYKLVVPKSLAETGRSGTFRTLPDSQDYVDEQINPRGLFNFSFEYACGNNQNIGRGPELVTYGTMLEKIADDINFAVLNGDWLYESQREFKPSQWLAQVDAKPDAVPKVVRVAPTVVGAWQNYKHYYNQSPNLSHWHRQVPTFFTYDDHEILNDVWGAGTPGLRDRRAVFRDIGVRAWYDYLGWSNPTEFKQPVHFGRARLEADSNILIDEDADFGRLDLSQANNLHVHWGTPTAGVNKKELDGVGGAANAGVYQIAEVLDANRLKIEPAPKQDGEVSYSIGRRSYYRKRIANCDFFFTDTRGQRQMHDTSDPGKVGLSMLGPQQRDWLMKGMQESDADFLFVVSSVNLMVPHIGGVKKVRSENKDDAWTVFLDEREKLVNFWDKLSKPVLVLSGDLHNSFVIKITDNVWEMASGPHNSNNHRAGDEGDRPANGPFKYGPREVDIRWSTYFGTDVPRERLRSPGYCVVQINNVFDNAVKAGQERWVAFPRPQVIFRFYDGRTGKLRYAESILASEK